MRRAQAQYVFDRFGKFPGTVPSIFFLTYLQAHHLDLEFYDQHFAPGAYLRDAREPHGALALTRNAVSSNHADERRLTSFSHGAGCGCKLGPQQLSEVLAR